MNKIDVQLSLHETSVIVVLLMADNKRLKEMIKSDKQYCIDNPEDKDRKYTTLLKRNIIRNQEIIGKIDNSCRKEMQK